MKKNRETWADKKEAEKIYEVYRRVQSGKKEALNELFKATDIKQASRFDDLNKEYRISHMDNVLDSELVLNNEQNNQEKEWLCSVNSKVIFQFSCLNQLLYKKKRCFLSRVKNTGYENGKKLKDSGHSKYYEGRYDVSDLSELMYETIIEIFTSKVDENNCLTLDGKKNVKIPICDGESLLKNISYFTSRKINKRAKGRYLDILEANYFEEEQNMGNSYFDQYVLKQFEKSKGHISRLMVYAESLEWLRNYDICKLFKENAYDIQAIIETIANCEETFAADVSEDNEKGIGMSFVKQEVLKEMIRYRHNRNIRQENISKDLELIEQRLLDHLFYSLNYKIRKATESKGIYKKESERFLYGLDKNAYIKMFSMVDYELYGASIKFTEHAVTSDAFDQYFNIVTRYRDMVIDVVSLRKGKKKYDMVNLLSEENDDLVDNKREALYNIANTLIDHYRKKEIEYQKNKLKEYEMKSFDHKKMRYWEAELSEQILRIRLFSSEKVKKPICYDLNRGKLMIYCGCRNFYICDTEKMVCYLFAKKERIISKSNESHEILIYKAG